MSEAVAKVIALVRELDVLEKERSHIDGKIRALKQRIADLVNPGEKLTRPETVSPRILQYLEGNPGAGYPELTKAVYGTDAGKERNRIRTMVFNLKKRGLLRTRQGGGWEVVDKAA